MQRSCIPGQTENRARMADAPQQHAPHTPSAMSTVSTNAVAEYSQVIYTKPTHQDTQNAQNAQTAQDTQKRKNNPKKEKPTKSKKPKVTKNTHQTAPPTEEQATPPDEALAAGIPVTQTACDAAAMARCDDAAPPVGCSDDAAPPVGCSDDAAPDGDTPAAKCMLIQKNAREYVKSMGMRITKSSITRINEACLEMIAAGAKRAKSNGRVTLQPHDI